MARGPELVGELVRLRPIGAQDFERAWELVQDPETRRVTGATQELSREEIQERVARTSDVPGLFGFAITSAVRRDEEFVSEEMLGEIVLREVDARAAAGSLRLNMLSNYRGRGYGREAIQLVLAFAFERGPDGLGLNRVQLDVLSINPRARMLYESLGFVEEGRLREAHHDGESYCDVIVMSILEHEFNQNQFSATEES